MAIGLWIDKEALIRQPHAMKLISTCMTSAHLKVSGALYSWTMIQQSDLTSFSAARPLQNWISVTISVVLRLLDKDCVCISLLTSPICMCVSSTDWQYEWIISCIRSTCSSSMPWNFCRNKHTTFNLITFQSYLSEMVQKQFQNG